MSYTTCTPTLAEYLIIGDETALPAATGRLSVLPPGIAVTALLEVPSGDDRRDFGASPARVAYFVRNDVHAKPGHLLLDAPRVWRPRHDRVTAWVSGESTMTTAVRRILVKTGVRKADISFTAASSSGNPSTTTDVQGAGEVPGA